MTEANGDLINLSQYGQMLEAYKEALNNSILAIAPDSWQSVLVSILPAHWQEWLLPLLGGPFFLLFLAEWFYQSKRGRGSAFGWRRAMTNFSLGGSYLGFELVIQALVVLPICLWLYQYRLFTIEVTWLTAIPIFIAVEFSYYWFHRASHRVNWFWSAHVVHHSDDKMNLSTAMRQSLLYSVTGWWLFFVPLMLLGVHPVWVFFFYALDLTYQFFIHTETVGKFPRWVEYIFDTPSNHRAHHGANGKYIDKNYGGVIIVFDRWFGTYVEEDTVNHPVEYGAVGEASHDNIGRLIFDVFYRTWQRFFRAKGLKNKLKVLFRPPSSA
ncbi:sterol desaturase family protein [uncultured Psychrobacter sp.]|uniref:sterol desaturase family protein n=1 Tax=uncultured Psychrobacter sp. TaxID=259303 RepID=UPI002602159F|nr:sterol desaturase family protein [uncultured Psychrobacter sp.]